MSKTGSIEFILSKTGDTPGSYSNEHLSDPAVSVSSGKRPRRDSMDTTTANSADRLDVSCKSPRISEASERTQTPSVLDSSYISPDPPFLTWDQSSVGNPEKLAKKQRKFLRQWYEVFARDSQSPCSSYETLSALATLVQARPQLIHAYLQSKFPPQITTPPVSDQRSPVATVSSTPATALNAHLPAPTLALITKYLSTCARRRSATDGRRSVNTGPLCCTFGCGYRTSRPFDWRRHEETHAPQDLWLCTLCSAGDVTSPFLGHRKDKFLKHVRDMHKAWEGEVVLGISRVDFRPGGGGRCGVCGDENRDWEERCRHVLGHFENGDIKEEGGTEEESEDGSEMDEGDSGVSDDEKVAQSV